MEHNTNEKERTSSLADIQMHLNRSSLFMTTRAFLGSKMCSWWNNSFQGILYVRILVWEAQFLGSNWDDLLPIQDLRQGGQHAQLYIILPFLSPFQLFLFNKNAVDVGKSSSLPQKLLLQGLLWQQILVLAAMKVGLEHFLDVYTSLPV